MLETLAARSSLPLGKSFRVRPNPKFEINQLSDALVNCSVFIARSARAIALKLEDNTNVLFLDDVTAETPTSAVFRERSQRYLLSPRNSDISIAGGFYVLRGKESRLFAI